MFLHSHPPITNTILSCLKVCWYNLLEPSAGSPSQTNIIIKLYFNSSYAMDGLSADKLRIFLHPVETDSIPKKKTHENESAGTEETGVTTLTSIMDKRDQVNPIFIWMKNQ
jgi:hypothetical protein